MNKPELFGYTRRAAYDPSKTMTMMSKAEETKKSLGGTTSHWKTDQQMTNEISMAQPVTVSQRPLWSYNR